MFLGVMMLKVSEEVGDVGRISEASEASECHGGAESSFEMPKRAISLSAHFQAF